MPIHPIVASNRVEISGQCDVPYFIATPSISEVFSISHSSFDTLLTLIDQLCFPINSVMEYDDVNNHPSKGTTSWQTCFASFFP
jgi:hypothetical protein